MSKRKAKSLFGTISDINSVLIGNLMMLIWKKEFVTSLRN